MRLVMAHVVGTVILTVALIGSGAPGPALRQPQHFFLLNMVLTVSAITLLFSSTGFAVCAFALFTNRKRSLHWADPQYDERGTEKTRSTVHTLVAANLAVCGLAVAFCWSIHSLDRCFYPREQTGPRHFGDYELAAV